MLKLSEGGKAKVFAGLKVRIDRPKGFVQQGKDAQGQPWRRVYKVDYGYLPGTEGGDGEGLDVFFGPSEQAETAYLVRQNKDDGSFDEFKLMIGFGSKAEALACYDDHIPSKLRGAVREVPMDVLRMLTGQTPAITKVAESFAEALLEHKVAAPKWLKVLQGGGDLAEEVRKRMDLPEGLQEAIRLSPKGGLLTPMRLPKSGLAQEGLDVSKAQAQFKDPLLNLDTVVDMQTRAPKGVARHTKSLRDHLNTDGLKGRELVGDISAEDRLALNTHPNLLDKERWAKNEANRYSPGAELRDALQTGSNPSIELQALMDPGFGEALEKRVRSPYRLRRHMANKKEWPSQPRELFDKKKSYLEKGERPPSVTAMEGVYTPNRFAEFDQPSAAEIERANRTSGVPTINGLRAWRDVGADNPEQLNFGIVPPDAARVGWYGKRQREDAAHSLARAEEQAAHQKTLDDLRSGRAFQQRDLFFENGSKIEYAHYPRTKDEVERAQRFGAMKGRALDKRTDVLPTTPPPTPEVSVAGQVPPQQVAAEPSGGRNLAPLALGGTALVGGALGVRHLLKRRAPPTEGSSEP